MWYCMYPLGGKRQAMRQRWTLSPRKRGPVRFRDLFKSAYGVHRPVGERHQRRVTQPPGGSGFCPCLCLFIWSWQSVKTQESDLSFHFQFSIVLFLISNTGDATIPIPKPKVVVSADCGLIRGTPCTHTISLKLPCTDTKCYIWFCTPRRT